jgi:hypothetical protein
MVSPETRGSGGTHLGVQKGQTLVDVLDLVDPHFPRVGFAQLVAGYDFEQLHQGPSVGEVDKEVLDLERKRKQKVRSVREDDEGLVSAAPLSWSWPETS